MATVSLGLTKNATPDDSTSDSFNWLFATATGDLVLNMQGGSQHTIIGFPAGSWMPVGNAVGIAITGTTVTGLMVA